MSFLGIVQILLLFILSLREAEAKHNVKQDANNLMNPEARIQRRNENAPSVFKSSDAVAHGLNTQQTPMEDRISSHSEQKETANASRVAPSMQNGHQTKVAQCANGFGGMNIQVMNQWIQIMSQDTEKMFYFFNKIQETERQFDVKMDAYVGELAGIDEKLNQMTSQIQWESSASRQILQFTETTKTEVDKLQKIIKEKDGYFLGKTNSPTRIGAANIDDGTLEYFNEYLSKILNLIAQTRQDEHRAAANLNQSVTSLAQMVISLHDARLSTTFETASNNIDSSIRKQIYSIQENLDKLNTNLENISHFGYNLRSGTDSIMNTEQLMNSINKIALKLLKKAREGCSEAKLLGGYGFNVRTQKKNTHQEKYGRSEEENSHALGPSWTAGDGMAEVN